MVTLSGIDTYRRSIPVGVLIRMTREDGRRNFALLTGDEETSVFSGESPRQAALKAARRLDPESNDLGPDDDPTRIRLHGSEADEIQLREEGTDKVHVYHAWSWLEETTEDAPDWLGETVVNANVAKSMVKHLK